MPTLRTTPSLRRLNWFSFALRQFRSTTHVEIPRLSAGQSAAISGAKPQWIVAAAAGAALAMSAAPASAQVSTWDRGAATNLWTDAANWNVDGVPISANSVSFTDTGAGTVDLGGTTQPATGSYQGLSFTNATAAFTIQNGTINTTSLTHASGANVTNTISAAVNISGALTVSAGKLVIANGGGLITGPVSVSSGATLDLAAPSSSGIGTVSIDGGRLTVRGSTVTTNNALFDRVYLRVPAQVDLNPISNLFAVTPTAIRTITGPVTYDLARVTDPNAGGNTGLYSTNTLGATYQPGPGSHNNISTLTTAKLTISIAGDYTFGTRSDDGSVLYVDFDSNGVFDPATEMIVNNNNFQGYTNRVGTRNFAAGTYNMAVGFYQGGCCDNNGLEVRYASGSVTEANYNTMTVLNPTTPIAGTSFSFDTTNPASIANSNLSIIGSNSVLDFQSTVGTAGNLTFNAGTSLTIEGQVGAVVTVGTLSGTGAATLTTNVATTAGGISGITALNKGGSNTLTLGADAAGFAGQLNVLAGILRVTQTGALGSAAGLTAVSNGAQLNLVADNIVEPVTLAGTGPGGTGALASSGAARTFAGPVTLTAPASIISGTQNNALTLTGGIATAGSEIRIGGAGNVTIAGTGITGNGSVRKADGGSLNINAASNYSGPTNVENGNFEFTQPLSATSAINVTGGNVNARSSVNPAATVNITNGTYNAFDPGSLNGTNVVSSTGLLRIVGNIGATGSISANNRGRIHFDAGNGNTASVATNLNVTSGGVVRSTSGVADLAAQNIVIAPLSEIVVPNELKGFAITNGSDTDPNSLANINTILAKVPNFTAVLPGNGSTALDFPQDSDGLFNTYFNTTLPGAFTAYFTGRFTAQVAGVHTFQGANNDDVAAVAIDFNNNGSFADAGTDLFATANCCNNNHSVNVPLAAGQSIGVFWGARDTGGGSGLRGRFIEPAGGLFTTETLVSPGTQGPRWASVTATGGGDVQVDALSEIRANTMTGATALRLGGKLTLSAGVGAVSNARDLSIISVGGAPQVEVGAGHTLTAQNITAPQGATLTKTGAGTLTIAGSSTLTLNDNSVVASDGLLDMSNTRLGAAPQVTAPGLLGLLYVNSPVNPRNNPSGVSMLLATNPTNNALLTSAGPNGGLDFRNDDDVANFFGNPIVGATTGNNNYTKAFVGSFFAQFNGSYGFGLEQNDDNTAIFVDSNQNGIFELSEQVLERGCCLQVPPNGDFASGTVSLTANQRYDIAFVNQDTGGGGNMGVKFQEPEGALTAFTTVAPGAANQTTQFSFTSGGGDVRINLGGTLSVRGTDAPVAATVGGTLRYSNQGTATNNTLSNLSVLASQTGTIETGTNQTLTLGAGTTVSLAGNLVKTGPGRLAVNVTTTGTGSITVNGGVLGGTGIITGPLIAGVSGTVAPGNSVGTLSSGDFSLAGPGATLAIELDPLNTGALGFADNLNVTGPVSLNGGNLSLSLLSTPMSLGQQFLIISNDGADSVLGTFGTVNGSPIVGNSFTTAGNQFQINYAGGDNNDVVLTTVPEPGTVSVLMLGLGALLTRRRRNA